MLIIEILLITWVWNRGWKAWSLLPTGIAVFCTVMVAIAGGGDFALGTAIICTIFEFIALIVMGAVGRKEKDTRGVYYYPAGSPDVRIYNAPAVSMGVPVYQAPLAPVYNAPVITPAAPIYQASIAVPAVPAPRVQPAAYEPATARAPINTAKLVLPDNSEIGKLYVKLHLRCLDVILFTSSPFDSTPSCYRW
jgi:hypothetical protein